MARWNLMKNHFQNWTKNFKKTIFGDVASLTLKNSKIIRDVSNLIEKLQSEIFLGNPLKTKQKVCFLECCPTYVMY